MFLKTVAAHGDAVALRCMDDAGGWKEWTFNDYRDQVAKAAAALRGLGLGAGDKVVMMMRNRPDFHWLDTAAQFLRITPVSIYNSSSIEEIVYLSTHCEAQAAILEDAASSRVPRSRRLRPSALAVMGASWPGDVMALGALMDTEPLDLDELARRRPMISPR
jgi:long-chain acyl-CoA synthetase